LKGSLSGENRKKRGRKTEKERRKGGRKEEREEGRKGGGGREGGKGISVSKNFLRSCILNIIK
jgi:hypothetical protein